MIISEDIFKRCVVLDSGCTVWSGPTHKKGGYGCYSKNKKTRAVHVVVYESVFGEIPKYSYVRQKCGNRLCVKPDHLVVVTAGKLMTKDSLYRFWRLAVPQSNGCIEWQGCRDARGYGRVSDLAGESRAHRASYRLFIGDIPDGLSVLHKCDNPACCNPDHLFLGNHKANFDDMVSKGRRVTPSGERNSHAVLSAADVLSIRNRFANGESQYSLARKFGVKPPAIYKIVNRKTWLHV